MPELYGNIDENGKLNIYHEKELRKWISQNRNKTIVLSITANKRKRSNPQNDYYWGVVIQMVQRAMNGFGNDYTKEEVHEFLKKEFNWEEKEMTEGYCVKVPRSTTRLSTIEFMDYKEKIQQFGSEVLGIYIPDPLEQLEMNYKNHTT